MASSRNGWLLATLAASFVLSCLSGTASAQVMDFEIFPDDAVCPDGAAGVIQNGLSLMDDTPFPAMDSESCVFGPNNVFPPPGPIVTNGTVVFGWCGSCSPSVLTITLMRQDAAPFALRSIDFSRVQGQDGSAVVDITGFPDGGGPPVTVQHTIDSDAWETVTFTEFDNVGRIEITKTPPPTIDTLLDNIVTAPAGAGSSAAAIPVMAPPLYALLGLLLLLTGTAWVRRRP